MTDDEAARPDGVPRAPRDTRRELLDAGWRIFARLQWDDLLRAIRVREVAAEAGVTTGAFVHHFSTTERFYAAMAADARERLLERSGDLFTELDQLFDDRNAIEAIDIGVRVSLDGDADLDVLRRAIVAMTVAEGDGRTGPLLKQYFQAVDDNIVPRIRTALGDLDREPLPPFTASDLAVILSALNQGLSLRRRATANAVDPGLASSAFIAVAVGLTRHRAEEIDLGEVARHLSGVPDLRPAGDGQDPRGGAADARRATDPSRAIDRDAVVDAAARIFAERAPSSVTLDELAAATGVRRDVLIANFGTVGGLAAACFTRDATELEGEATSPLAPGESPEARIERSLLSIVELCARNRPLTEAFLRAVLHVAVEGDAAPASSRTWAEGSLTALLQPWVRLLRDQGRLRPRVDSAALASTLVNGAVLATLTRPHDSAERVVDDTCDLVLRGALAP